MKKLRVIVFPCGSECGLEVGRSLKDLKEIELWGASSIDDHGKFAYSNYVGSLPYVTDDSFIEEFNIVLERLEIDFIYPAMDSVVDCLAQNAGKLKSRIIGSPVETTSITLSKLKTYEFLSDVVQCPKLYTVDKVTDDDLPLFLKPEVGCGSKGVMLAYTIEAIEQALVRDPSLMILEYLPGEEYTVDCFTNGNGELLFSGARKRCRVARGISVNTKNVKALEHEFRSIAMKINRKLRFRGAWFFQVKHDSAGKLSLLEVAPRVAGSMGLHRCKGVNLPLLSVLDAQGIEVSALENEYDVEYDRAFYNKINLTYRFTTLYLDFDDCLLLDGKFLNPEILKLMAQCRNKKLPVILISRHAGDLRERLEELGVLGLVDEIHHLRNGEAKSDYMKDQNGFLIDDSFAERLCASRIGVPSLGPESVEALIH